MTPGPLVIGLGNELRGDDAAGLLVARAVAAEGPDWLTVAEHEGEPLAVLDLWADASSVLVVDAVSGGEGGPGAVHRFDAAAGPLPALFGGPSTHALGLAETIELGRALDRLPERLTVVGIEGARFEIGSIPEPAVLEAVASVARAAPALAGDPD